MLVIILSFVLLAGNAYAAADDESLLLTAKEKYEKGRYASAIVDLNGLIVSPHSSYQSAARLLLGKCQYKLRKFKEAENTARNLIAKFPFSRYVPHAHYLTAEIVFKRKEYYDTAWHLLITAQTTFEEDLNYTAREKLAGVFGGYLDSSQQKALINWVECDDIRGELESIQRGYMPAVPIGVILDLSGTNAQNGQNLLLGIQAAKADAGKDVPGGIELVVRDGGGSVIQSVIAARELICNEKAAAIIVCLDAACTAAIAGVTSSEGVPLIVPTPQSADILELGDDVFQLLAGYKTEGKIAAEYVIADLEASRAAILAPVSEQGSQSVKGFASRFKELGGDAEVIQWYYSGATNYKRQLDKLIQIGADSLAATYELTDEDYEALLAWDDEPEEEEVKPEEGELEEEPSIVDSLLEVYVSPINFFDVLYVPFEGEEILLLAPQIAGSGFNGYFLGGSNCLDHVLDESNRRYVNGLIFPSHFSIPKGYSDNPSFAADFKSITRKMPDRWNLMGWDAFNYLALAFKGKGWLNSQRIKTRLQDVREFESERLEIRFPEGIRENQSMFILGFENGSFHTLKTPQ